MSIMECVNTYEHCYAGLRSIKVKLDLIKHYYAFLTSVASAANRSALLDIVKDPQWPQKLQEDAKEVHLTRSISHRQDLVLQRYGSLIKAFENEISDLEVNVCSVCRLLKRKKDLQYWQDKWVVPDLQDKPASSSKVCTTCAPSLRKGSRPRQAVSS